MKKWFFSDNGKVTAPLSLMEARAYLADNPSVYGWHPSFSQWKPVTCIPEFADVVPLPEQSLLVPKELTDKFLAKKQRLQTKLTSIEDSIQHTQSTLNKFEKQIADYKSLTVNLNDEVKGAIGDIEKKYSNLNKKMAQVKNAISIAEVEISDAINSFDQRVNSNDVFMPSCHEVGQPVRVVSTAPTDAEKKATEEAKISKAKLAQAKLATPHKRVEAETKPLEKEASVEKQMSSNKAEAESKVAKEGFGMKNIMKSVFKGDKKVESAEEQPPMSMAERLKMAQNNT